jgi:hypothetical protein
MVVLRTHSFSKVLEVRHPGICAGESLWCCPAIVYQTAETGSYSTITLIVHPSIGQVEYFGFSLFKIVFEFLSKQKA